MVTQVSLDGIFYFGAKVRLEMLLIIYCFRSKDDLDGTFWPDHSQIGFEDQEAILVGCLTPWLSGVPLAARPLERIVRRSAH